MINPNEGGWTRFSSAEEEFDFLKGCGLLPAKATASKLFYYRGPYSRRPVFCRIVGCLPSGAAVAELPGGLHCINTELLSELQSGASRLYKEALEIHGVRSYVAFDVETTGLSPQTDSIIEIGAVKYAGGERAGEFSRLVNPGVPLPPVITSLTGIRDSDLDGAPDISEVLPALLEFLGKEPVIAHNAPFDRSFLEAACARSGLRAPTVFYDTLKLARDFFPGLPGYKLQDLITRFGLPRGDAHRASSDAEAAAALFELCREAVFAPDDGEK